MTEPAERSEVQRSEKASVRVLNRVAVYFSAATAALAIAADLSGVSQWYETTGKNTIFEVLGLFALACVVALTAHHVITRSNGERFFSSRRRTVEWCILVAVALLMFGIRIFDPQQPVVESGQVTLESTQGVDLDTDQERHQDIPGVDLSPSRTGTQLNAMTNGAARFALPEHNDDSDFDRCSRVPEDVWSKTLLDVYRLRVGDIVCVRTDRGNLAALTLTHVPSAGEPFISFDFITWLTTR